VLEVSQFHRTELGLRNEGNAVGPKGALAEPEGNHPNPKKILVAKLGEDGQKEVSCVFGWHLFVFLFLRVIRRKKNRK
jgi:hypothetical protein